MVRVGFQKAFDPIISILLIVLEKYQNESVLVSIDMTFLLVIGLYCIGWILYGTHIMEQCSLRTYLSICRPRIPIYKIVLEKYGNENEHA